MKLGCCTIKFDGMVRRRIKDMYWGKYQLAQNEQADPSSTKKLDIHLTNPKVKLECENV